MEQNIFPDFEPNSEISENIFKFLDDIPFIPIDLLLEKELEEENSLLLLPSPKRHCPCSELCAELCKIYEEKPQLFQKSSVFYASVSPKLVSVGSSVQNLASKERRKKIREKTLELGELIPGGKNMNTAEMLQTAFNYVKFLQAQVGILRLMESFSEFKIEIEKNIQILLASSAIQEKLTAKEMCIAPIEMYVDEFAENYQIQSEPFISTSMDQFIQSIM